MRVPLVTVALALVGCAPVTDVVTEIGGSFRTGAAPEPERGARGAGSRVQGGIDGEACEG